MRISSVAGLLGVVLLAGAIRVASAQDRLVVQAIVDGEVWASDSGSRLLTRNDGHAAPVGRLQLWTIAGLRPDLQLVILGEVEAGRGRSGRDAQDGATISLEQVSLLYSRSPALSVHLGRIVSPVGTFAHRRLSTANPLIGSPDSYPVSYPWGVQVGGSISRFDYRAALVSLPATNTNYVPEPGAAPHGAVGFGFTPLPELRVGTSFTWGPYLGASSDESLPAGTHWWDFAQRLLAFDARFSRGYAEFHAEAALSSYEVPGHSEPLDGAAYYTELKYTWMPRLFTAARLEWNNYPLVRPRADGVWMSRAVSFYNLEIGAGYRVGPNTTVKATYQRDRWATATNGRALAFQLSRQFDVLAR